MTIARMTTGQMTISQMAIIHRQANGICEVLRFRMQCHVMLLQLLILKWSKMYSEDDIFKCIFTNCDNRYLGIVFF